MEIDSADLVPGDWCVLAAGDRVPADLRLCEVGQSAHRRVRADRRVGARRQGHRPGGPGGGARRPARHGLLRHPGRLGGAGLGVVTGTGPTTELGRIGRLIAEVETLATPLTRQMAAFGRVALLGDPGDGGGDVPDRLAGCTTSPLGELVMAAIGFAVAAIPEGLPAILTITLALGVQRMARRNAIIRRLPAVETLGSVTVICTDKTGTLTRNEMTVRQLVTPRRAVSR